MFQVAPYVGAWIETPFRGIFAVISKSHPTWVRGLKPVKDTIIIGEKIVAPYVGAWIETPQPFRQCNQPPVAPYVGAWIETYSIADRAVSDGVAPYVGAWIETHQR